MADEALTFSVSVNKVVDGKNNEQIIKNNIRRISKTSTWFDLFDYATDTVLDDVLPRLCYDNFEKLSAVSVSATPHGEQFNVDPYEKIHILSDFDTSLKYVTINLKIESSDINNNRKCEQQDAMAVLMAARTATKLAKPLDINRARFTGRYNDLGMFFLYALVICKPPHIPGIAGTDF